MKLRVAGKTGELLVTAVSNDNFILSGSLLSVSGKKLELGEGREGLSVPTLDVMFPDAEVKENEDGSIEVGNIGELVIGTTEHFDIIDETDYSSDTEVRYDLIQFMGDDFTVKGSLAGTCVQCDKARIESNTELCGDYVAEEVDVPSNFVGAFRTAKGGVTKLLVDGEDTGVNLNEKSTGAGEDSVLVLVDNGKNLVIWGIRKDIAVNGQNGLSQTVELTKEDCDRLKEFLNEAGFVQGYITISSDTEVVVHN